MTTLIYVGGIMGATALAAGLIGMAIEAIQEHRDRRRWGR